MKFRSRLENSDTLAAALSWLLSGYLRLCYATSRKTVVGLDALNEDLGKGAIMLVAWHSDLAGSPAVWPFDKSAITSIHDTSPAGRLGAETYRRLGVNTYQMGSRTTSSAETRQIIRAIRGGQSLGIAADGPKGPARIVGQATLDWARISGLPIYLLAWNASRALRLKTWDNLVLPLPLSSTHYILERWSGRLPRHSDKHSYGTFSTELGNSLDQLHLAVDAKAGVSGG